MSRIQTNKHKFLNEMGRFVDCQLAICSWGAKAKYRKARIALLRKSSTVYLAIFFSSADNKKFPIEPKSVELLPAAIRFKELGSDLFVKEASDEQRYANMRREIKVLLNKDRYSHGTKAGTLERFISSIPPFTNFKQRELLPPPTAQVSARLIGSVDSIVINQHQLFNNFPPIGSDDGDDANNDFINAGNGDLNGIDLTKNYSKLQALQFKESRLRFEQKALKNNQLKKVKISGLEKVPKQLWHQTTLNELTLSNCNLASVPKQLETFADTLTFLDLSCNRINRLPRSFCCKMSRLNVLDLNTNQIETLPIEIKFLCRLVELKIPNNKLRMLPSTFSDLKCLRVLNVANNNLSQLPAFRRDEIRLRLLDVSFNPLDGALNEANTFEVHPSTDGALEYNDNLFCPLSPVPNNKFLTLFEISMLKVVRCDRLLKLASQESLPRTIVSTMQRDIFKCYKCSQMSILPAYNSTDILDYVDQVELRTTGNYRHGMTFMKLLCRSCFDNMSS